MYTRPQCTLVGKTCSPGEQMTFRVTPNATLVARPGYSKKERSGYFSVICVNSNLWSCSIFSHRILSCQCFSIFWQHTYSQTYLHRLYTSANWEAVCVVLGRWSVLLHLTSCWILNQYSWEMLLRSAVGIAPVLRSLLVIGFTTSYFPLIVLGYQLDPKRSYGPLSESLVQTRPDMLEMKFLHSLTHGTSYTVSSCLL